MAPEFRPRGQQPARGEEQAEGAAAEQPDARPPIHASNAWNPTGRTLLPVPHCRLYYAHLETLAGPRTQVFLGAQQHLTFVADLEGVRPADELRAAVIEAGTYPYLVDLEPAPDLPRIAAVGRPGA